MYENCIVGGKEMEWGKENSWPQLGYAEAITEKWVNSSLVVRKKKVFV